MRRWFVAIAVLVLMISNGAAVRGQSVGDLGPTARSVVAVYDPTGQSPKQISWAPYPAVPPLGFHWQHTGSPAIKMNPATGQPMPGQFTGAWILVRDGYRMPQLR